MQKIFSHVADLIRVLHITPDLYSRFISLVPEQKNGPGIVKEILAHDWKFEFGEPELWEVQHLLGLS